MSTGSVLTLTVFRDRAGRWRWRMQARNGRIVADSAEGYTRRSDARRAAVRLTDTATWVVKS